MKELELKHYVGTKVVGAAPMTVQEASEYLGKPIDMSAHKNEDHGYLVQYKDGYQSFSPASVFEESYHCCETFKDRLLIEFRELQERHKKLEAFVFSDKLFSVQPPVQQKLLLEQEKVMGKYLTLLELRLRLIDPEIDKVL